MEVDLIKAPSGYLVPSLEEDEDKLRRIGMGEVVHVKLKVQRNAKFLRKFFAMLSYAYGCWEPQAVLWKGQVIQKNFERFRKDLLIMAGYFETSYGLDEQVHVEAKSISFAALENDHEFEKIYSAVVQVVLDKVLTNYDRGDLDEVVDKILGYT
jgi:hypothetical protein